MHRVDLKDCNPAVPFVDEHVILIFTGMMPGMKDVFSCFSPFFETLFGHVQCSLQKGLSQNGSCGILRPHMLVNLNLWILV